VVLTILSLFAHDIAYPGRPAFLPGKLFADMDRDPLETVALLFQLRLGPAAPPLFEPAASIAYAGSFSFFCPSPHSYRLRLLRFRLIFFLCLR